MEGFEQKEHFSSKWFRDRAMNALKQTGEKEWDFSDSLLLYTPGTEGEYESIQKGDDPYAELITKPEHFYLQSIAERVIEQLPRSFQYVDLGPGTAHKEQYIFDAARAAGKRFIYKPVDISRHYLDLAARHAQEQGIQSQGIQSSFEDLPSKLQSEQFRFVSLGLTFTNYHPPQILPLLRDIRGTHGAAFIDVQVRDRVDMNQISDVYANDVRPLADSKIQLLGLNPHTDIAERFVDDGIRMWCVIKILVSCLIAVSNPEIVCWCSSRCAIQKNRSSRFYMSLVVNTRSSTTTSHLSVLL